MHAPTNPPDANRGDGRMSEPAHARLTARTAFQRDLLYAVRALEQDGDPPKGLAIKTRLETTSDEEINHSRLYQNLDGLVDDGLLEKGQKDDRTNEYATTDAARELLEAHARHRVEQTGLQIERGELA